MTDVAAPVAAAPLAPAQDRAAPRALSSLLLLALSIVCSGMARAIFSPVQEMAETALRLSDSQISQIQGVAVAIPTALIAIPLGRLIDRTTRVRLLLVMAVIWTVGTLMVAVANGFYVLFAARMLCGLAGFCVLPIAIATTADLYPAKKRGATVLMLSIGQSLGIALAFLLGGALVAQLTAHPVQILGVTAPWRGVHVVFGLLLGLISLPLLLLREPVRRELGEAAGAPFGAALRELWSRRAFLAPLFVAQIGVVMADIAATVWAAPVLARNYGLRPDQAGPYLFIAFIVSGVFGSIIGGLVADRAQRSRLRGGLMWAAATTALVSVPATFFCIAPSLPVFTALLTLLLLCGAMMGLMTTVALTTLIPNETRGVCLGAFIVISAIVGIGAAPWLVSQVSLPLGGRLHIATALFYVDIATAVLSFAAFALAARNTPPRVPETIAAV